MPFPWSTITDRIYVFSFFLSQMMFTFFDHVIKLVLTDFSIVTFFTFLISKYFVDKYFETI